VWQGQKEKYSILRPGIAEVLGEGGLKLIDFDEV